MADADVVPSTGPLRGAGRGIPIGSSKLTGKAKTQARQNEEADLPPTGVTADEARDAASEIFSKIGKLSQAQLTLVKGACEARLVPAGLAVVVAKRRAIAATLGAPSSSAGTSKDSSKKKGTKSGEKPTPVFDPGLTQEINGHSEIATLAGKMSSLFGSPVEGEPISQSLKKDFRTLTEQAFIAKFLPKWNWYPEIEQYTWTPQFPQLPFPNTYVNITPDNWDKVVAWLRVQKWKPNEGSSTSWIEMAAKAYFDGARLDLLNTPKSFVNAIQKVINSTTKIL